MTEIRGPWTAEQVRHLNDYQRSGRMHPFTCGRRDRHPANPGILIASVDGWTCPADDCDYRQDWAHAFMAAPDEERAAGIMRAVSIGRRAPAGRLIYLANRLEAALEDGTLLPSVLAAITVLRDTAAELEEQQ